MAEIRSKNVYELLGNDPELDPNRAPEPPTKALDKPTPRVGKRDAPKEAPAQQQQPRENTGRRGQRFQGNEAAYRDRNAGRRNNVDRPVDEGNNPERRGFNARGDRGGRSRNDRQNRSGVTDSRKQINQGWGGETGDKELDDEKAGQKIAQTDENEPQTPAGEEPEEAADKAKSFADYLAEKAAAGDLSAKPVRAANEGTKPDGKWAQAKEFKRGEEEEEYIKGKDDNRSKGPKQRKEKNYLDVDLRFVEAPRSSGERGGPRGRGGRGGRGVGRGGRGNGPRGGGERATGPTPVTVDEKNFPSLGA
ncbi:putative telomere and ribosome associated protein Stm1 [Aspergillus ruber CBS 135680]|uniref:Hyaluronan/mRNA-binding protein domain-containing protein n=1 Tax=Aspergillus ruber (strain CBS 135680) TaxID=1388766 RepID=A0A017SDC0_ASPRC|nr:uncharacterized protein EURHEDRAFT_412949 [Aspergillus ruber CBS 135680]EYE94609.1 hypothetical protein EURHEDRAFT_412949 [Aspergillus ruber CBS 135680]